jgi:hypothetical protein
VQSRRHSALEAVANIAVGYAIALLATAMVLPLFGFEPSVSESAQISLVFTVVSLIRSYLLRRAFNFLQSRNHAASPA